jgi:hypothetical protein
MNLQDQLRECIFACKDSSGIKIERGYDADSYGRAIATAFNLDAEPSECLSAFYALVGSEEVSLGFAGESQSSLKSQAPLPVVIVKPGKLKASLSRLTRD